MHISPGPTSLNRQEVQHICWDFEDPGDYNPIIGTLFYERVLF